MFLLHMRTFRVINTAFFYAVIKYYTKASFRSGFDRNENETDSTRDTRRTSSTVL